jgi:dTDP-4-dehydrorhamnose reductase
MVKLLKKKKYSDTTNTPNPKDAYAKSKLEAEKVLWKMSKN